MEGILSNQAAVVTGAASGIGRAITLGFAREGADVVVADVQEEPRSGGAPTHEEATAEYDVDATFVQCDVTEPDDVDAAVAAADAFDGVDVMVNNAAIFLREDFLETSEEEYERLMDINAKGTYFGAQRAARRMVENGGGSIINISSINGLVGNGGSPAYSMSKGGVRLLTYALAHGLGSEGVRVNAIHPGSIETEMNRRAMEEDPERLEYVQSQVPLDRQGTPAEIADVAVFLASDLARYVTGESVTVDGGWVSHN